MPELHTNKLGSKFFFPSSSSFIFYFFLPLKELVLERRQEVPLQIRSHLVTRKEPFQSEAAASLEIVQISPLIIFLSPPK